MIIYHRVLTRRLDEGDMDIVPSQGQAGSRASVFSAMWVCSGSPLGVDEMDESVGD